MSLALNARIKDLEARLAKVETEVDVLRAEKAKSEAFVLPAGTYTPEQVAELMPAKRKPGRPPKNG